MSAGLPQASVEAFALRVAARAAGNDWSALVVPPPASVEEVAASLVEQLSLLGGLDATIASADDPPALTAYLKKSQAAVIVVPVSGWGEDRWRWIDERRAELATPTSVVLVTTVEDIRRILGVAPHLSSWFGTTVYLLDFDADVLSEAERQDRLDALRRATGLSDDEVVARAHAGTLPGDSLFGEWLILLGHGDLL